MVSGRVLRPYEFYSNGKELRRRGETEQLNRIEDGAVLTESLQWAVNNELCTAVLIGLIAPFPPCLVL